MNLHRVVRVAEIAAVVVLGGFAALTYRELATLRKAPVSLPSYQFEIGGEDDATRFISTRGTWITDRGTPEQIVTTTIECRKVRMECIESDARVVFVSGQGLLESNQTAFEIERWTEAAIVTRAVQGRCATRQLLFDLREKRASSRIGPSEEKGVCREQAARKLELVTGYKARIPE